MAERKPVTPALKATFLTIILLLVGLVYYFTGQVVNRNVTYVLFVILFVGILLSSMYYAKQMNGNVTFGNIFAEGFKTTAAVIVLSSICTIISLKFIFPGIVDKLIEAGKLEMKQQGSTDEQVKTYFEGMQNFIVPLIIGFIIFFFGIVGALGSLAGAVIANKKPAAAVSN